MAPIVTFYGDDFTGSTDALAQFCRFGMSGLLLFELLDDETLLNLSEGRDVIGIAGISRALPATEMEAEVRPVFERLARLNSRIIQYKVCSTFDSSAQIGSIGRVTEVAFEMFNGYTVPVVAAQPSFGRYTVFGNHFVRDSTEPSNIYRLERHPGISNHPSTPMKEADLVLHLSHQMELPVKLFDLLTLNKGAAQCDSLWEYFVSSQTGAVVFDTLENHHLVDIARLIWSKSQELTRFIIGLGGISFGLGSVISESLGIRDHRAKALSSVQQMVVLSGSASLQTERQISWALNHGWRGIRIDVAALISEGSKEVELERIIQEVLESLVAGLNLIVYTTMGPNDPSIQDCVEKMHDAGLPKHELTMRVGTLLGNVLQRVFEETNLTRVVVAGGDTSGYTLKALEAFGLEIAGQIVQNGALCKLKSRNYKIDGKEIFLTGGQVGEEDVFETVRNGGVN